MGRKMTPIGSHRKEVAVGEVRKTVVLFDDSWRNENMINEKVGDKLKDQLIDIVNKCQLYPDFPGEDLADILDTIIIIAEIADSLKNEEECEKAHRFINDMQHIVRAFGEIGTKQEDKFIDVLDGKVYVMDDDMHDEWTSVKLSSFERDDD